MFFGGEEEDSAGPVITIANPEAETTQSGTFTMVGNSRDVGGDNSVLKVEVSLDGGVTWQTAYGTENWSYTVNSLSAWGVIKLPKTVKIKATDTDTKRNTTTISINYNIDNTIHF